MAVDLETEAPAAPNNATVGTVERVIDGDTLLVQVQGRSETIRLLGIDTPEKTGGPRPAECFGAEASEFARALLPSGTAVTVSRDHETRDQYGRLLAYVHRADGLFVNLAMVEHGFAAPLSFAPNTTLDVVFDEAADRARRTWIGFWSACGGSDVALAASTS